MFDFPPSYLPRFATARPPIRSRPMSRGRLRQPSYYGTPAPGLPTTQTTLCCPMIPGRLTTLLHLPFCSNSSPLYFRITHLKSPMRLFPGPRISSIAWDTTIHASLQTMLVGYTPIGGDPEPHPQKISLADACRTDAPAKIPDNSPRPNKKTSARFTCSGSQTNPLPPAGSKMHELPEHRLLRTCQHSGRKSAEALHQTTSTGTTTGMKKASTPIPQANLGDEIWTISHIATYFGLRTSAAYDRAREPGFPDPVGRTGRFRRWHACDVREYSRQPATPTRRSTTHKASSGVLRPRKFAA